MPSLLSHSRLAYVDLLSALLLISYLVAVWIRPHIFSRPLEAFERFGRRIAHRRIAALLIVALMPVTLRLGCLIVSPIPAPGIADEFSYLLASDTFAHERLTNPTHPMWIYFETIHVNQLPTYMSKYPPAQGVILAIGQLLGHPWIGVLLSVSLMCVAVFWMLGGWLPQRWAFLGALLVALRLGVLSYWINSYWGGAIPAMGGALVMGAIPRLIRLYRVRDAIFFAAGVSLLANSRPFEGSILFLSAVVLLVSVFGRNNPTGVKRFARRIVSLPVISIASLTILFMGYYNWRATNNPLLFPYTVNDRMYSATPHFIWQRSAPPLHSPNPQLESLFAWERQYWGDNRLDSLRHLTLHVGLVAFKFAYFFLWPQLLVPFALSVFLLRDTKIRFFFLQFFVCFLGMIAVVWSQPHYAAPLTGSIFLIVIQALRHLRLWSYHGRSLGLGLSRAFVVFSVAITLLYVGEAASHPFLASFVAPAGVWANPGNRIRENILSRLGALAGNHLVIVRYSAGTAETGEWVYNRADIDRAKVVWAREIPGIALGPLLKYFQGRRVWLLEPRFSPPRLTEYLEDSKK
jgi:hypothetical protein